MDKIVNNVNPYKEDSFILKLINEGLNKNFDNSIEKIYETHLKHMHKENDQLIKVFVNNNKNKIPKINGMNDEQFKLWYYSHGDKVVELLNKSNFVLSKPPKDRIKIHDVLYNNTFVSLGIQEEYEKSDLIYEIYKNDKCVIYMYKHTDDNTDYITKIMHILNLIKYIATNCNLAADKNIEITFFMSNCKKKVQYAFLDKEFIFTPENINSGSTYLHRDKISIWRIEEYEKVLIHELIHCYKFDFYDDVKKYGELKNIINKVIKINGVDALQESYTEALATIIYASLVAKRQNSPYEKVLKNEIIFLFFQVCKIIKIYGGEKLSDIKSITINQLTSVRSYFIIKFVLLFNYDNFINFIDKGIILNKDISRYIKFIDEILLTTINNEQLNFLSKQIISKIDYFDDQIKFTMRMTISE